VIRRIIIHHNDFIKIWGQILRKERPDTVFNVFFRFVEWDDNRDFHYFPFVGDE